MLLRTLTVPLHRAVRLGETVLVQGPRLSGKTTLLRREFPGHRYLTLDDPQIRALARQDPAGFLARLRGPAIIDDVHRAPSLVAHLSASPIASPVVLASSLRLQLPVVTFELYPPTRAERERRTPLGLEMLGRFVPVLGPVLGPVPAITPTVTSTGLYAGPNASEQQFLDRDVRGLVNVHDLDRFEHFLQVARSHSGQILDQQALAAACDVAHRTVARWLAVLDMGFLTLRLPPSDVDFSRRLVKSPKLHFLEGGGFESQAVSEIFRNAHHAGTLPHLRYWRDSNGFEIPLVVQSETSEIMPVGIAETPTPAEIAALRRWMELAGVRQAALIAQRPGPTRQGILRYSLHQL